MSQINNISSTVTNATQRASRIESLTNSIRSRTDAASNVVNSLEDAAATVQDPISASLRRILFKINNLTSNVEQKINALADDTVKSLDNRGRVELIDSSIVITVTPGDVRRAEVLQQNVKKKIDSINNTLRLLTSSLTVLNTVSNTVRTIQIALQIQEVLLTVNPVSKATFTVFKKAIKLLFLKDAMKEYANILSRELSSNKQVLDRLVNRFRGLNVQIRILDESNKGNRINEAAAESLMADSLLSEQADVTNLSQEYINISGKEYILVVEKYNDNQLIARAKDKISGLLVTQTAPSFFSTGEQLIEELKNILDTDV